MNFPKDPSVPSAAAEVKLAGRSDQPSQTIPSLNLKKLLVPTDFSENSKKALVYAVRLAQRNNSSLILFHVFELPEFVRELPQPKLPKRSPTAWLPPGTFIPQGWSVCRTRDYSSEFNAEQRKQFFDGVMRRSEERLVTLSRDKQGSNLKIETSQRLGTPFEEIVKVAKEREVDLIVMATHGYTDLKHFFLGSTAERVVRLAPCPVLVVRWHERDFVS